METLKLWKELADQDLIEAYQKGYARALEVLINRHRAKLISTILLITKDRDLAEDLLQEALIKMVRVLDEGRYNEKGKFLPWMLRVARNIAIDHFRKERRHQQQYQPIPLHLMKQAIPGTERVDQQIMQHEDQQYVRRLVQQLPQKQKEVLILRYYNDMSFKEIAELTQVSINTALGRMRYALINLRKLMDAQPQAAAR